MVLAASAPAPSADVAVSGVFSQEIEAADKLENDPDSDAGLRSITDAGLSITARTPQSTYVFVPGVRMIASTDGGLNSVAPRFSLAGETASPRTTLNTDLFLLPQPASDGQFEDTGAAGFDVLQLTFGGGVGLTRLASPRDSLNVGFSFRAVEFTETSDDLTPNQSVQVSGGWRRSLSPRTGAGVNAGVSFFRSDAADDTESLSFSLTGRGDHRFSPRAALSYSLGPQVVFRDDEGQDGDSDPQFGVTGGFDFAFDGVEDSFSIGLAQGVDQNSRGEIEDRTTLRATYAHRIDSRARLSLGAAVTARSALFGDEEERRTLSLTPSYVVDITPEWTMAAGYRFRVADGDDDVARNSVFFRISRNLSLAP